MRTMSFRDNFAFLGQFLRSPRGVGAVSPSSRALARTMVASFDWPLVSSAAEYGPGTGVFTESILAELRPDAKFFAIEANAEMVAMLKSRLPNVAVYHDSVGNVAKLCERQGIVHLDAIACGLPWASFSDRDQTEFLEATGRVLRSGGQFATFAYLQGLLLPAGQRFRRKLREHFREIKISPTVWHNLPPAFVYRCRK